MTTNLLENSNYKEGLKYWLIERIFNEGEHPEYTHSFRYSSSDMEKLFDLYYTQCKEEITPHSDDYGSHYYTWIVINSDFLRDETSKQYCNFTFKDAHWPFKEALSIRKQYEPLPDFLNFQEKPQNIITDNGIMTVTAKIQIIDLFKSHKVYSENLHKINAKIQISENYRGNYAVKIIILTENKKIILKHSFEDISYDWSTFLYTVNIMEPIRYIIFDHRSVIQCKLTNAVVKIVF